VLRNIDSNMQYVEQIAQAIVAGGKKGVVDVSAILADVEPTVRAPYKPDEEDVRPRPRLVVAND
jgi:hypothetical protein